MHTLDLLAKAEATRSLRSIAIDLGLNPNALAKARSDGKLSPAVAASLADYLGEPPGKWALTAIAENEKSAPMAGRLARLAHRAKSYFSPSRLRASALRRKAQRTDSTGAPSEAATSRIVSPCDLKRLASA